MDKKIKFYTIAFVDQMGTPTNMNVCKYLNDLEDLFLKDKLKMPVEVIDKSVHMFKFIRADVNPEKEFIIPFGTLKQNTPYQLSSSNPKEITPANMKLFDVNLFYYNANEGIVAMTCDRGAPNNKIVSAFLSNFIKEEDYLISVEPILYETGIEVVRNSKYIKTVILTINLDGNVQKYYDDNIHSENIVNRQLLKLLLSAKGEIENRTFRLELGLGHSRRDSMNKENTLSLLNSLDLTSDVIKEISLNFVDGTNEKIQVAKLKNHDIELNELIPHEGKGSLLAGELLDGISAAIERNRRVINTKLREYNRRVIKVNTNVEINIGENNERLSEEVFL